MPVISNYKHEPERPLGAPKQRPTSMADRIYAELK